jgi:hypothetical protein
MGTNGIGGTSEPEDKCCCSEPKPQPVLKRAFMDGDVMKAEFSDYSWHRIGVLVKDTDIQVGCVTLSRRELEEINRKVAQQDEFQKTNAERLMKELIDKQKTVPRKGTKRR